MAKKYQKAKGGASSLTVKIVAIVLMLVMICAIVFSVLQFCMPSGRGIKPSEWFGGTTTDQPKDPDEDEDKIKGDNAFIEPSEEHGIKMMSARISSEDFKEYGISEQAETAHIITATVSPENATYKTVQWSWEWDTAKSSHRNWAENVLINDYFSFQENGNALTVSCLQAFGAPLKIKATSVDNPEAIGVCCAQYVKRVSVIDELSFKNASGEKVDKIVMCDNQLYEPDLQVQFGLGTVEPDFMFDCEISLGSGFYGYSNFAYPSGVSVSYTFTNYLNSTSNVFFAGFVNKNLVSDISNYSAQNIVKSFTYIRNATNTASYLGTGKGIVTLSVSYRTYYNQIVFENSVAGDLLLDLDEKLVAVHTSDVTTDKEEILF